MLLGFFGRPKTQKNITGSPQGPPQGMPRAPNNTTLTNVSDRAPGIHPQCLGLSCSNMSRGDPNPEPKETPQRVPRYTKLCSNMPQGDTSHRPYLLPHTTTARVKNKSLEFCYCSMLGKMHSMSHCNSVVGVLTQNPGTP